ncbi:MAG: SDR family oxidoreductase [Solirubrobacteraceae bacterium]|nr:SDR family oxidoreductase [Solirubrobacteraceae bacterium]
MSNFPGRVAVVTGAGSGIGRALALDLARRGAKLALSDVNAAGVAETAAQAEKAGSPEVIHGTLDVSDRAAFLAYGDEVVAHFGKVNQLYNNAGIAFTRTILESEFEDYERVFNVNLWGVINGTKAFLPHLIASGEGHVTNISSLNGLMAQPEMSHYVATKFAVRGFTETLRMEMITSKAPVKVSVVHPGGIATSIASNASKAELDRKGGGTAEEQAYAATREKVYNKKLLKLPAEKAAEIITNGVAKNKPRIVVGNDAKALDVFIRIAPKAYQPIIGSYFAKMFKDR